MNPGTVIAIGTLWTSRHIAEAGGWTVCGIKIDDPSIRGSVRLAESVDCSDCAKGKSTMKIEAAPAPATRTERTLRNLIETVGMLAGIRSRLDSLEDTRLGLDEATREGLLAAAQNVADAQNTLERISVRLGTIAALERSEERLREAVEDHGDEAEILFELTAYQEAASLVLDAVVDDDLINTARLIIDNDELVAELIGEAEFERRRDEQLEEELGL